MCVELCCVWWCSQWFEQVDIVEPDRVGHDVEADLFERYVVGLDHRFAIARLHIGLVRMRKRTIEKKSWVSRLLVVVLLALALAQVGQIAFPQVNVEHVVNRALKQLRIWYRTWVSGNRILIGAKRHSCSRSISKISKINKHKFVVVN